MASTHTVNSRRARRLLVPVVAALLAGCDPQVSPVEDDSPSTGQTVSPSASSTFGDSTPRFGADGRSIVFVREGDDGADIASVPVDGGQVTTLVDLSEYDLDPAVAADGSVVFDSSPNGFAQLHVMSSDGAHVEPISEIVDGWATYPTWSPEGDEIAYACGRPSFEESDICVMTAAGELRGSTEPASESQEVQPSWSPDGSTIVFSSDRSGTKDLYSVDLESFAVEQLTNGPEADGDPTWSPDGRTIAFTRSGGGTPQVCILRVKTSDIGCVTEGIQPGWSPDGRALTFYRDTPQGSRIYVSRADGTAVRAIT